MYFGVAELERFATTGDLHRTPEDDIYENKDRQQL